MFRWVSARIYELYIICERTACWGKHAYATTRHSSGPSLPARRRRASGCPLYARAGKHPRLFGWSGAGSWIRTELLASRYERKHMVPTWRHFLLALHRLSSRRRMAKHWSSRGSVLVADAAAAVPYSLGGLPVAAGEQDLSSFGQNLLHLLHPAVGAAQSWQVISLPVANATSPRHRKRTSTYSVTCCMYWYTCGWTARLPPPPGRE